MSIRVRKQGSYEVVVRPFQQVTLPTREAAETVELDLKLKKKLGALYQEQPVSLGDALDDEQERRVTLRNPRPATIGFYRQTISPWGPLRHVLLPSLRRNMVEDHIVRRAKVAPSAAGHELQFAKSALKSAESRGQGVDRGIYMIPPVRTEAAEGQALEYERLEELAAWMPERLSRLVLLCGTVGFRWTEAVNITDDWLDLDGAEIRVPRDLNKARKPKAVPLARVEVQVLREQLLVRPAGSRLLFPTQRGGVYTKTGFRAVWVPALARAGMTHDAIGLTGKVVQVADFKFHWLRHTAGSLMARAGMDPAVAARRLGHSDGGALFLKTYRHLYESEVKKAVGLIDAYITDRRESGEASAVVL